MRETLFCTSHSNLAYSGIGGKSQYGSDQSQGWGKDGTVRVCACLGKEGREVGVGVLGVNHAWGEFLTLFRVWYQGSNGHFQANYGLGVPVSTLSQLLTECP